MFVSPMYRTVPPCPRNSTRWFTSKLPPVATGGGDTTGAATGATGDGDTTGSGGGGGSGSSKVGAAGGVFAALATFGGGVNAAKTTKACLPNHVKQGRY